MTSQISLVFRAEPFCQWSVGSLNETQLKMKIIFCEISEVSSGLALNDLIGIDNFYINPYWQISGTFLRPFYWKTHPSKNHEYPYSFLKNRVVTQTVLLENSSNRHLENSGASHRPFYWKTHPKESIQAKIIFYQFWGVTQAVLLENSSRPFFKVFLIF